MNHLAFFIFWTHCLGKFFFFFIFLATSSYKVVVIGGGAGGSSVSHWCRKFVPKGQIAVIDPADVWFLLNFINIYEINSVYVHN